MNEPTDLLPLPDFMELADCIPVSEWKELVEIGCFIDYDGFGYPATADGRHIKKDVYTSQLPGIDWPEWATHLLWFNK